MGENKILLKVVAILLLPVLMCESVWSMPASELFAQVPSTKLAFAAATPFSDPLLYSDSHWKNPPQVSSQNGERVESFQGNAPYRVFVIQDAHALPDAQKSAAQILEFWVSRLGLNLVGLEGATGVLPHSSVAAFPNRAARGMLAESLLDEAVIGGPEYLQMTRYPSLSLRGVEDPALYEADRAAFLQVLEKRQSALTVLESIRVRAEEEALKVLPVEYLRFRKYARQAHENGDWQKYLNYLQKLRLEMNPEGSYPAFDFWRKAHEFSEKVSAESIQSEIKEIEKRGRLGRLLAEQARQMLNGIEPEKNVRIEAMLWKQNPEWLQNFPAVTSSLKASYLMRRIGSGLFEEVAKLEKELVRKICAGEEQKRLAQRLQNLDIARSLLALSLTAPDYEQIVLNREAFKAGALASANEATLTREQESSLAETLIAAEKFYQIAMKRDEALAVNFIREMQNENQTMGALVIGGFHTAGLLRVFREKGISYEVVRPKVKEADPSRYQDVYEKRMVSQISRLESVKADSSELIQSGSFAQLHLQTPRRMDPDFAQNLYTLLNGLTAAMTSRPTELSHVLASSARMLTPDGMRALRSMVSINSLAEVRVSPNGENTVFWFPGDAEQVSVVAATGPNAKTLTGTGAVSVQAVGREVWIRRGGVSPFSGLESWKKAEPKRSEVRTDDHLAFLTQRTSFEDLKDDMNFKRALEIRLETYAGLSHIAGSGEVKTLTAGGVSLSYKVENGRAQLLGIESNWKNNTPETRAAVLIYLEEYLSGVSLRSLNPQEVKSAATMSWVVSRALQRIQVAGLWRNFVESQEGVEGADFWQGLTTQAIQRHPDGKNLQVLAGEVMDFIVVTKQIKKVKVDLPDTEAGWTAWNKSILDVYAGLQSEMAQEISAGKKQSLRSLMNTDIPEFLARYVRVKMISGLGLDAGFMEGLGASTRALAVELALMNEEINPGRHSVQTLEKPSVPVIETELPVADPLIQDEPETEQAAPVPSFNRSDWFAGLPPLENGFGDYSVEDLMGFLRIFEERQSAHPEEFLAENKILLPYHEALVEALEQKMPKEVFTPAALSAGVAAEKPQASEPLAEVKEKRRLSKFLFFVFIFVDLSIFAVAAGALQFLGFSLLTLPVLSLPAFLTAYAIIVAYRAGWMGGLLMNEWGHQFAALSAGKWRTFFTLSNWLGNTSLGDWFSILIPGMSLPLGAIYLDESEKGRINYVRWVGWLIGFSAFISAGVHLVALSMPPLYVSTILGTALLAQIVSFVSDFIYPPEDETCAACGNLGGMAVSQGEQTAEFMQKMFRDMGDVLQVRGGQAGGSIILRQNQNGQVVPHLSRSVNTKRGVLRDKMDAGAAKSLKKGKTPSVYFDFRHVRFGTSSAPSEIETHPHQWLPNRETARWVKNQNGTWTRSQIVLGSFISHNGDFDDYRIGGKMRGNGDVGAWLEQVLGYSNPALGDSPKAAGMMDFLITQGMWDASFRYAYHTTNPNSFDEARSGRAPTYAQIQTAARIFEAAFEIWKNQKEGTRESLIALIQSRAQGLHSPELIQTAVDAFFNNDSYQAVRIFSSNAEGTFGFLAGSSIYPNKIVMYGDSQPLSLGFDPTKKFMVWTSEPAVLKVPLSDGGRIPYRLDLLQDVGEIFEITLPSSGVPQLKVYSKIEKKELSTEEMQQSFRLVDMLKSPYVSPLPALDYQNEDLVARDLSQMAGALDRLREDWLKADSTNRQTSNALVQILVEKYIGKMIKDHSGLMLSGVASQHATSQASILAQEFLSREISEGELMAKVHHVADATTQLFLKMRSNRETKEIMNRGEASVEDPVDILITGMANNIWTAEPFAARLSEMFPRLRIATTSSNKILRALKSVGLQTPIKKITVRENSRLITISRNTIVIVADGDMGQDFAPLNAAIALRKLIGDRLFMVTPEFDTKLGALVQNFHKDAPFGKRIFRTFIGKDTAWRPAEASTLSQQAVDQTFTEMLLRLGQDMRELFPNTDPFHMKLSKSDFDQLRMHNREHTRVKLADITGHNLDGTSRKSVAHEQILKPFARWSRHIAENVWTWYAVKIFVLLTVTLSFPPSVWIGLLPWAESLGMPLMVLGVHAVDALLYAGSAYIFKFFLRLIQGRATMHRQGTRSITIADAPKVNQIIKQYLTKLTAQATFLTDFFVDSSNPSDHGAYKDPQRVRRGGLIVLGLTEGVLVGLGHAFKSAKLYGSQAQGIQSLPYQEFWDFAAGIPVLGRIVRAVGFKLVPPEIVTVGQHPRLEPNAASENVYLGERAQEIKASSDRLVADLLKIPALRGKGREVQSVVQGRLESLNDFATGDFNKDVASLSQLLMKDFVLDESAEALVEIAVEGYMRQHVFLTGFIEERFFQPQRIAAMQVGFHHMVSRYSYSANKLWFRIKQMLGIGHRHWETKDHLRAATTASTESGADVTSVAQRMDASGHALPKVKIDSQPEPLPFQMVQSQIAVSEIDEKTAQAAKLAEEAEALRIAQLRTISKEARERLVKIQKKVVDFELGQLQILADLAKEEKDAFRKIVFQAVFHRYARTRDWIGANGVAPQESAKFNQRMVQLKKTAGVDETFRDQSINRAIPQIGFDLLRKKHFGNPRGLAEEIATKVMSGRSELRKGSDADVASGLKAQDAMRSGMAVDRLRSEMRTLLELPNQTLHEASASILGVQVSDAGLVILERPFDPVWVRQFMTKLPKGARVVMRAPDENAVDRAAYSRELAAEIRRGIFSFEFSDASSENWMRDYLGSEFDPASVIQVESPKTPSELDDEMLLLAAPMAAGHVLVLGQSQKLNLPGMRLIQISAWISQLYDAVMATQTSA